MDRSTATGSVELMGRADSQLKLNGHRIELEEIEYVIHGFPHIVDAAVVAQRAEGRVVDLHAFFVGASLLDTSLLAEHVKARLPHFMVPRTFNRVQTIPHTLSGKKDRQALARTLELDRREEPVASRPEAAYLEVIASVLQHDLKALSPQASFADYGGDSIRMIMLQREIARRFAADVPLLDLLAMRTVGELAALIEAAAAHRLTQGCEQVLHLGGGSDDGAIFFIHDISGEVDVYRPLAAHLPERVARWAVRQPGSVHLAPTDFSIGDLAREYAHQISARATRRTSLCGWSMGAVLAVEVARLLEASAHPLHHVVLIDPPRLELFPRPAPIDVASEREFAGEVFRKLPIGPLVSEMEAQTPDDFWTQLVECAERSRVPFDDMLQALPPDIHRIVAKYPARDFTQLFRRVNFVRSLVRAWQRYAFSAEERLRSDVTFVQPTASDPRSAACWEACTTGCFSVARVPGDHFSIFMHENVEAMASTFSEVLRIPHHQRTRAEDGQEVAC